MRLFVSAVISLISLFCLSAACAQPDEKSRVNWQNGPISAKLGSQAQLYVPEGYEFTDPSGARSFLEDTQNVPSGNELGILASPKGKWFVIFEFADVGYVKDEEKTSLDADSMLNSIRKATDEGNEERKRRGWGTMTVVGWMQPPHYDDVTHNLEWALEGKDEKGESSSNLNTRYLGRRGYMSVTLVGDADKFKAVQAEFRKVMTGFSYTPENDYRAFVKGDKVAEYGLSALIVGGAAAVAAKTGLFKLLLKFLIAGWKLVLAGLAALGALLKRLFRGREPVAPTETAAGDGH